MIYRLKCDFFKKEIEWVGHETDQQGIRPLHDKLDAITNIDIAKNEKELKSFLGGDTIPTLRTCQQIHILRKLLKKQNDWAWTEEHTRVLNNLKNCMIKIPCFSHHNANNDRIITTDASTNSPGAPNRKTAKNLPEKCVTKNGLPQTIRTDNFTAFTGKEIRDFCKFLIIKLIHGTPYIHTLTGLERGITRREHLKLALYLRLKNRKTFFRRKNLKFLNFFLSENVA